MTSPLSFKARVVLPYSHCGGECNVHSLRSTSGATLADLLAAGAAGPVPTYCSHAHRIHARKQLAFCETKCFWIYVLSFCDIVFGSVSGLESHAYEGRAKGNKWRSPLTDD